MASFKHHKKSEFFDFDFKLKSLVVTKITADGFEAELKANTKIKFSFSGPDLRIDGDDVRGTITKIVVTDSGSTIFEINDLFVSAEIFFDVAEREGSEQILKISLNSHDLINGTAEDDVLFSFGGKDFVFGHAGNDRIFAGDGQDEVRGGTGHDVIFGEHGNDDLFGEQGLDFIGAGDGNDFVSGGDDNDTLYGERGNDLMFGDEGDDLVDGGEGNDRLFGGTGQDRVFGADGNDDLFGEGDNDFLGGGDGQDVLSGGAGVDSLHGEAGHDILFGNAGDDDLNGGLGNDDFVFGRGDGRDRIADFGDTSPQDQDVLVFNGGVFGSYDAAIAASRQQGADVVITLDANTSVTLANVQLANLTPDDFRFF